MSKRFVTIAVTLLVALTFILFMSTFTVRYSESAVVTTFSRAGADSVVTDAGLGFKWPYPIQSVKVYDTRARLLQLRSETQQTADDRQIVAEAFVTWAVADPLLFYQRFGGAGSEEREHYRAAERTIESLLRSAMSEIGRYRMSELFAGEGQSKLPELEERVLSRLAGATGAAGDGFSLSDYGVEALTVGVNQIVLPEETTAQVFNRMKASRERLAAEASSAGRSDADTIRFRAEAAAERIRSFAMRRAEQIRVQGDTEAARWQARLAEEPRLAVFDAQLEFLRNLYAKRTTIVLPTTQPGMSILDPAAMEAASESGAIPPFTRADDAEADEQTGGAS
jgi:membrane protease subunit HflC